MDILEENAPSEWGEMDGGCDNNNKLQRGGTIMSLTDLQPYTRRALIPETDAKNKAKKKCDETVPVEEIEEGTDYYADASS